MGVTQNKAWSWGCALGRGVGGAIGSGGAIAISSWLASGTDWTSAVACALGGGFVGGFLGTALGFWWDEPFCQRETFVSASFYTTVVTGMLTVLCVPGGSHGAAFLTTRAPWAAALAISGFLAFLAAMSRSLLDDLWAQRAAGLCSHWQDPECPWRHRRER